MLSGLLHHLTAKLLRPGVGRFLVNGPARIICSPGVTGGRKGRPYSATGSRAEAVGAGLAPARLSNLPMEVEKKE